MIERLIGLQAQLAQPPFVGLWTRITSFRADDLARSINDRGVVKATLMRATLHLCSARDYPWLRAAVQPALTAAAEQIAKQRKAGPIDKEELLDAARRFLADEPRTYAEITGMLEALKPGSDAGAMRYSVRTHLPLVQVPTDSRWCYPSSPAWALAESWLGKRVSVEPKADSAAKLVKRYLSAFGPATAKDFETWSYLPNGRALFDELRDQLVVYHDEKKRELFDVPESEPPAAVGATALLPSGEEPAPVRFLPEFDNVLLSYEKRSRVVPDEFRKGVFLPGLRIAATYLVDGYVAGSWKTESKNGTATLALTSFKSLDKATRGQVVEEGEALSRFMDPEARRYEVVFAG